MFNPNPLGIPGWLSVLPLWHLAEQFSAPALGWGLCMAAETKGQILQLEQSMWKKKLLQIHLPWYEGLLFSEGAN